MPDRRNARLVRLDMGPECSVRRRLPPPARRARLDTRDHWPTVQATLGWRLPGWTQRASAAPERRNRRQFSRALTGVSTLGIRCTPAQIEGDVGGGDIDLKLAAADHALNAAREGERRAAPRATLAALGNDTMFALNGGRRGAMSVIDLSRAPPRLKSSNASSAAPAACLGKGGRMMSGAAQPAASTTSLGDRARIRS